MVKTGRIAIRDFAELPHNRDFPTEPADWSRNLTALRQRLKIGRRPSIYETYLLEAARQIEQGAYNLAIVQTVMILDWFANEIIEDHLFGKLKQSLTSLPQIYGLAHERMWEIGQDDKIKVRTTDKFNKYLPAIGVNLTPKLREELKLVIDQRNEIVHRTQASPIECSVAVGALDTGMAVLQHCMTMLLSRRPNVKVDSTAM